MANAPLQFPGDQNETHALMRTIRSQVSLVRALLDEVERLQTNSVVACVASEQLIDELTRLGCRTLEAAAALSKGETGPIAPISGENVKRVPGSY